MPCHNLGGGVIVCTAPKHKVMDKEPVGERWCFKCRAKTGHTLHVQDPMSPWFDTEFRLRCDKCGELATTLNGDCVDLGKWDDAMRAALDRVTAEGREWLPRTFFCLGCQAPEPEKGAFPEGYCPECGFTVRSEGHLNAHLRFFARTPWAGKHGKAA